MTRRTVTVPVPYRAGDGGTRGPAKSGVHRSDLGFWGA